MGFLGSVKEKIYREDPQQVRREAGWLLKRMYEQRFSILAVAGLSLAGTAMGLISSVASKYLIDAVTGFGAGRLASAAAALVVLTLGSLVLHAVSSRTSARIHVRLRNQMQHDAYTRILRAGWEALEPYRSGDLLNRLSSDVGTVSDGIIGFLPGVLSAGLKFVGAFVIMVVYDPVMALIALLGVPVTLALSRVLMARLRSHNMQMKQLGGEVMSFQEDSFRNLTSI